MIENIDLPYDPTLTYEENDKANGRPRCQGRNGQYAIGAIELMTMNGGNSLNFNPVSAKTQTILNAGFDVPVTTAHKMARWILDNLPEPPQQHPAPGAWTIDDVQRLLPEVNMMTADTEEGPLTATLRQDPLNPDKAYVETWTVDCLIVPWTTVTEAINAGRPLNADDEFAGLLPPGDQPHA